MEGASLLRVKRRPKARPAKYAKMSATHTRVSTDNKKLIPRMRACTTASQASHSASTPKTMRTGARNERPAGHTGAQQPGGACHPQPAAQRPQQRQRAIQPASPPTASTQGQTHSRQAQGGCIAAPIQAPPLPGTSRHEDQNHQGKGGDGGIEQRWQEDGQQDQGSDDAL